MTARQAKKAKRAANPSASEAQIAANQTNAQSSTGPKTEQGKAASAQNHRSHGLVGAFAILRDEDENKFIDLLESLRAEYTATTPTERLLVEAMAKHFWLSQRALRYQDGCVQSDLIHPDPNIALFMRYETMHNRAFSKALNDLLKVKSEQRKVLKDEATLAHQAAKLQIGFERNKRHQAVETRKQVSLPAHPNLSSKEMNAMLTRSIDRFVRATLSKQAKQAA